ncbi:MAG TPA: iron uptake transporter permease EfeU [Pseudonocardia sp.]|nr:iron uptake transporter permease EfeU [Pseudonocardia sp.]
MWAAALPNLLIGLREGLEAGLIVSILLAAVRRACDTAGARVSSAPVWLGVAAAVVLALSFGAVLTFYRSVLSTTGQEALGGLLSVVAVVLVTGMIFWMRRTARTLGSELRGKVAEALRISSAALALTAFLAVGREGLETALFLWTTAQVSGQTVAPLVGAAMGIAAAVALCVLLYRGAARLDLGAFFSRTAVLLIVIAAGVFAYGLGDLQDAGVLPGHTWLAFDLSNRIDPGSWWVTLVSGVTELSPTMTWLQVVAYVVYLVTVLTVFLRAGARQAPAGAQTAPPAGASPQPGTASPGPATVSPEPEQAEMPAPGRSRRQVAVLVAAALVVPPLSAALLVGFGPRSAAGSTDVTVTDQACAPGWSATGTGTRDFDVANKSGHTVEVNLIQASSQGIVGEIETLGPATAQRLSATLAPGGYFFRCLADGLPTTTSTTVSAAGPGPAPGQVALAVAPIAVADLQPAADAYDAYVRPKLALLHTQVATIRADLAANQMPAAQRDWMAAQLTWEQVGAAYDSFADLGDAIDGLPQAQPLAVTDPGFTGLHRLEYGLWHAQPAAALLPVADQLTSDITALTAKLPQLTLDPTDLPIRAHEILEDALRDHLNGLSDEGSGAAYPETFADVQGTEVVLGELKPLIDARSPGLLPTVQSQLTELNQALLATQAGGQWQPVSAVPLAARQRVDADIGAVLENLSLIPDLLEVPAH